jgi:hypothetical protein
MTWARPSIFRSSVTGDGGQFCQATGVAARKAEGGERLTRRCNVNLKARWNVGKWRALILARGKRVFVVSLRRQPRWAFYVVQNLPVRPFAADGNTASWQ